MMLHGRRCGQLIVDPEAGYAVMVYGGGVIRH
jgi:hypothetical protein